MTQWPIDEQSHQTPTRRSFALDMMSPGPASTMGRELIAAIIQIGVVVVLIFVVFPDRLSDSWRWALLAATILYFVVRFVIGVPKWRRH